jgi:hypothetical protein
MSREQRRTARHWQPKPFQIMCATNHELLTSIPVGRVQLPGPSFSKTKTHGRSRL